MEKTCLYDIFISYSRFDRAEVEAIIEGNFYKLNICISEK